MRALWACIAIGVTFLGCSSSSNNAASSCGKVAACGGDIVGTWKIVDACTEGNSSSTSSGAACPGEMQQVSSLTVSGTVTFGADMTYTVALTESVTESLVLPMSCISTAGAAVTCDQVGMALGAGGAQVDAGTSMATCTTSGSNCSCTLTASGMVANETGMYTISGNTLTVTPTMSSSGSTMRSSDYCVQGGTLHLIATSMAMGGAMGMPTMDLVATKE